MSEKQHTPLPWVLDTKIDGLAEITNLVGHTIAIIKTDCFQHGDVAVNLANGELIVRAVNCHADLLAALEAAFAAMTSVSVKTRHEGEILQSAARQATAALTKAKGGEG